MVSCCTMKMDTSDGLKLEVGDDGGGGDGGGVVVVS